MNASSKPLTLIVIGGGVIGCATAYALARAGQRVMLLEQFEIGNLRGSSHGPSRIIRLAYDGADYVRMGHRAYAGWRELEKASGKKLLQITGGYDIGVPGTEAIAGIRNTYIQTGTPYTELTGAQMMAKHPQIRIPDNMEVLYQADYGLLYADACVAAFAEQARKYGASIIENAAVTGIEPSNQDVVVKTANQTYTADRVIVCAGSWMNKVLAQTGLHIPLKVTKEMSAYYRVHNADEFMPDRFPLFLERHPGRTIIGSAFPIFGSPFVKVIWDRNGVEIDPDDTDLNPHQPSLQKLIAYKDKTLPTLGDDLVEVITCRYSLTPDEHFILDHHPVYPNVIIGSPCSGHGFKFAPALGEILCDLAVTGSASLDIQRFRLNRPALQNHVQLN